MEAHVGRAHMSAQADQVHVLGGRNLFDHPFLLHAAGREADGQAVDRRVEFERQLCHVVFAAGGQHALPELRHVFEAETLGKAQHHRQGRRLAEVGVELAEHVEHGLVAQVFERRVDQVEVAAFQHQLLGAATFSFLVEPQGLFVGISTVLKQFVEDGLLADFGDFGSGHGWVYLTFIV